MLMTTLLPWQEEAVNKLLPIRVGALYFEMGLGKTRTTLEMIQRRLDAGKIDYALWLCPCSVIENLKVDIRKHSNLLDRIIVYGIETLSSSVRVYELLLKMTETRHMMLIVDESNLVKNHRAKRTQRIITLAERCRYRLILNGTPVSRNEADLFAQWYILDPRILGYNSYWSFAANHLVFDDKIPGKVVRVLNTDYLSEKIAPYSYTVRKEDVLQLPEKRVRVMSFYLTSEQRSHYENVMDEFLSELLNVDNPEIASETAIYRTFTALQQVTSGRRIVSPASEHIRHEHFFDDIREDPRIECLANLLEIIDGKAIIWVKFQHEADDVLSLIEQMYGKESAAIFTGSVSLRKRNEAIERFRGDAQVLIANKTCAGYGLNLQFAHNVIYYNNDWNWATRSQSEDRVHRIGQQHVVEIWNIAADRTIDERILRNLDRKENLVDDFKRNLKKIDGLRNWLNGIEEGENNDPTGVHK